jgi:protoporphyrinogen oxidase
MQKTHVIIIGAGPAGLTAAYELLSQHSHQYHVTILESSRHIGGISRTIRYHGHRMDLGGHRFFSKSQRVNDWWNHFLPLQGAPTSDDLLLHRQVPLSAHGPDPQQTDLVMLHRQRLSRIFFNQRFFDYPVTLTWNTLQNLGLRQTFQVGSSYLRTFTHKLPETNLENFYINRFGQKLYQLFFAGYTEKLWGRHPQFISPDWGKQRVKGISLTTILKHLTAHTRPQQVETSLIASFLYPKYGPGQMWEEVAKQIRILGGKIMFNSPVTKLHSHQQRLTAVTYRHQRQLHTLSGDVIISSLPLKDLITNLTGDIIPTSITQIAQNLPYRDFVTVGFLCRKLSLAHRSHIKTFPHLIPDCWIYVQDPHVKLGRIQIFNNWSPYLVSDPQHTAWIGLEYFCQENDDFWRLSDQELFAFAAKELQQLNIINHPSDILDAHRERVPKAYPAYFDSYAQIDQLRQYLNRIRNLYCIGRNGQHRYNNKDHSMLTAFAAVDHLVHHRHRKNHLWDINAEDEYHETT